MFRSVLGTIATLQTRLVWGWVKRSKVVATHMCVLSLADILTIPSPLIRATHSFNFIVIYSDVMYSIVCIVTIVIYIYVYYYVVIRSNI